MMAAEHSTKLSALLSLRSYFPYFHREISMKPALGVIELTMLACGCCSVAKLCLTFATQWTASHQVSLSSTVSWSLLKFMSIESVMLSNRHIIYRPLLLLPQSFPALRSFPVSWLFTSGSQRTGALAPATVLPVDNQGWFPLELTDLIPLLFKGLSRVFSNTTVQKHQFFGAQPSLWSNSHICTWLLEKP